MKTQGQGQTAVITGANNGIGLALTRKMLSEGWEVIALIRSNFPRDDQLIQDSLASMKLRIYKADLSDFTQLKTALNEIKAQEIKIDLLFNNAGGSFPELSFSKQGREMHYELQTVVPYIIYRELKELLLKGNLKTVVNTSSNAFLNVKHFEPDRLERPLTFKKLFGPYATSKLALSLWTQEYSSVAASEGIKILSVDPGGNNTLRSGKDSGIPFYLKPIIKRFFPHPSYGAGLLYEAAMNDRQEIPAGSFLIKGRVKPLKFNMHGKKVLDKVNVVYEQEYVSFLLS